MNLLAPAMLGFGVLIPILILLYLLKVRRREFPVSSNYLWQDLLRDLAAHEPWQRLHWSVLLVLQLLVVGLIVALLARPFFVVQAQEMVHAVVILDGSGSMRATDVEPNRFEAAKRAAREVIRDLGEGSSATVIVAKAQPEVVAPSTQDRQIIERAIDTAEPSHGAGDIYQSLSLASALGGERKAVRVYLISDGAFDDAGAGSGIRPSEGLDGLDVRLIPVGVSGENQGITALSARPDPQNVRRFQLFARVRNYGTTASRGMLSLDVDGNLSESRQIDVAPGEAQDLVFDDLALGAKTVQARLSGSDPFPIDNAAYSVLDVRRASEILLVTQGNLFIEKVLGLLPTSEVFRVAPRRYLAIDPDRYDVVVFDGFLPDELPRGNVLVVNPPESSLFTIEGELRRPRIRRWERDDPVLQFVDLRDVAVARAQRILPPGWARTLIETDDGALMFAGELEGRRVVVIPFDLRQSNLPLSAAFPILMANIMGYLEPGGQVGLRDLRPGDSITLTPLPQTEELHIRLPNGQARVIRPEGRPAVFSETSQPGLYGVSQRAAGQTILEEPFAINASDERESDIRPRPVSLGDGRVLSAGILAELVPVNREIWMWLAPAALALLLFEWLWFHRKS